MKTCHFEGCGKPHNTQGLCIGHSCQKKKGKQLTPLRQRSPNGKRPQCKAQSCPDLADCKGLCTTHYWRKRSGRLDWNRPKAIRRIGYVTLKLATSDESIRVPKPLLARLKATAAQRQMHIYDVVVDILETHYKQKSHELSAGWDAKRQHDAWARRDAMEAV